MSQVGGDSRGPAPARARGPDISLLDRSGARRGGAQTTSTWDFTLHRVPKGRWVLPSILVIISAIKPRTVCPSALRKMSLATRRATQSSAFLPELVCDCCQARCPRNRSPGSPASGRAVPKTGHPIMRRATLLVLTAASNECTRRRGLLW